MVRAIIVLLFCPKQESYAKHNPKPKGEVGYLSVSGDTSNHANSGPEATSFRPYHSPNHIHLGKMMDYRLSTDIGNLSHNLMR